MRKIALLSTAALLSLTMCFPVFAGEWKENAKGWWYINDDGTNPADSWELIGDKWYYFKPNGYMNTGWIKVFGQWYYCESTGEMRTSDLQTDVFTFKFNSDGTCSNFYENTTPSLEAGWASYDNGSLSEFANALASGNVIYYNGEYLAAPDYADIFKHETIVYYHNVTPDVEENVSKRYALAELDIDLSDYYD